MKSSGHTSLEFSFTSRIAICRSFTAILSASPQHNSRAAFITKTRARLVSQLEQPMK